jgi:hypothetical protein
MRIMTATTKSVEGERKAQLKGAQDRDVGSYTEGLGPYEGELKGTLRHGRGKQLWDRGSLIGCVYDGSWEKNKPNGPGRFIFVDGSIFDANVSLVTLVLLLSLSFACVEFS